VCVQFGRWTFGGFTHRAIAIGKVRELLVPYGPDGETHFQADDIDILGYRLDEVQKASTRSQSDSENTGQFLSWDGRLDNRQDLVHELDGAVRPFDSDEGIVAAAYARWGIECLPKLIGDWALSIWDSRRQELILAKDFLGARPLFYFAERHQVQWCSVLDPLVLLSGRKFDLNREYIAGWYGLFPDSRLTPYVGIFAVPPSSYVLVRRNSISVREFWRFPSRRLLRANDAEYEEEFRQLFKQSVERRLRSARPILAELSGGMDSSSIVCVSDQVLRAGDGFTPRLDTVSYYSLNEPSWDELPYVSKVEELRGRKGAHIQVQARGMFSFESATDHFMATPGSLEPANDGELEFRRLLNDGGYRVVLSGIGGDEVLGGVPTPHPLLSDLFVSGRWKRLGESLLAWALALRIPVARLFAQNLALFFAGGHGSETQSLPEWLSSDFRGAYANEVRGYPRRFRFFGARPSFQDSLHTLEALRRQLSCYPIAANPCHRKAYPYLDRDFLEFLFAIPPDQLLRPGQRRSLMRRALNGVVPQELLNRKRKAFVLHGPLMAIPAKSSNLVMRTEQMLSATLGILVPPRFLTELEQAHAGERVAITPLIRAFGLERWFRNAAQWNVLNDFDEHTRTLPMATEHLPAKQIS
jgi:asparagine synthase (glutamine-hydrolysing)